MKTLFSILILISISFNAKANHDETLELDRYIIRADGDIGIFVYNKLSYPIGSDSYLWEIEFKDGTKRKYVTSGLNCMKYSECVWIIKLNKKGAIKVSIAH